jgi:anti-sigma B factor antagonist
MNITTDGDTLRVSGVYELNVKNSKLFRDEVRAKLTEAQRVIEIDLSDTMFLDGLGIAALYDLHITLWNRTGRILLIDPTPPAQQILELTRMHRIFEIVKR